MNTFPDLLKLLPALYLMMILSSCSNDAAERPLPTSEITRLSIPLENISFQASGREWEAVLFTFIQPLSLEVIYTNSGFYVSQKDDLGVVEGPGRICLKSGNSHFYYEVLLDNRDVGVTTAKDYRSPKTVNVDSSLSHQRIAFILDEWSNVVDPGGSLHFFEEQEIILTSRVGVYRTKVKTPLSAYYIQPGSCTSVPLHYEFRPKANIYKVMAGPLQDQYGNMVGEGTMVAFVYDDGQYTNQMEVMSQNGYATIEVSSSGSTVYSLFAKVNETFSSTIQLQPW
ncbi:MAG: hypothetical protein HKN87_15540 [Saprospiraceae bacterium]|nr:hypothetical protein [Saprospiraceae bacterium]